MRSSRSQFSCFLICGHQGFGAGKRRGKGGRGGGAGMHEGGQEAEWRGCDGSGANRGGTWPGSGMRLAAPPRILAFSLCRPSDSSISIERRLQYSMMRAGGSAQAPR